MLTSNQINSSLRRLGFHGGRLGQSAWEWAWNSDFDGDFHSWLVRPYVGIVFDEPPIIALGMNAKASVVNLAVNWVSFTGNSEVQDEVRSVIQRFGRCLLADSAIYLPDSGWRPAEKAVESIEGGADFEKSVATLIAEMRLKGSFSNLPPDGLSDNQVKRVKAVCSVWPTYFDRWEIT